MIISLLRVIFAINIIISALLSGILLGNSASATPSSFTKEVICVDYDTGNKYPCGSANCIEDPVAGYRCSGIECIPELLEITGAYACSEVYHYPDPVADSPCGGVADNSGSETVPASDIPLDPSNGGKSIDVSALQIGDIILSTTSELPSKIIRWGTDSPVSHSMLYVGDGLVVESVEIGVRVVPIETALAKSHLAVAVRYPGITQEQALQIRDFAGQQIGKEYDYKYGVFKQILYRLDTLCGFSSEMAGSINLGTGTNDSWFCSELILASYAAAGVPLTTTPPTWNAPAEIIQLYLNGMLDYVDHLKIP